MKKILSLLLVFSLMFSLTACMEPKNEEEAKQNIVATNFVLYSITKEIVKDTANVVLLEKKDGEEVSAKDLRAIREAGIIVYEGEELEPWINNLLVDELKDINIKTINATKGIKFSHIDQVKNLFNENKIIENEKRQDEENSSESVSEIPPSEESSSSEIISSETTTDTSENASNNNDLQDSLFDGIYHDPTVSESQSTETSEEVPSEELPTESSTTENNSSGMTEAQQLVKTYLEGLKKYDIVEYLAPIRNDLYIIMQQTNKPEVNYIFEGKVYSFAYSGNYDSFFLIDIQPLNAYTEADTDPYYWFSFDNIRTVTENIKEGLGLISNNYSATRTKNYKEFLEKINDLEKSYKETLSKNKVLILGCEYIPATLINTYNIKYCSPHTNKPLTLKEKANYCDYLRRNRLTVSIFSINNNPFAEELAKELQLETEQFNSLEIVPDPEKTFIEYMEENLEIIKKCMY